MIVNKTRSLAVLTVLGVLAAAPAVAADGKALFTDKGCNACHGEDAKTPLEPGYPHLAGQNADYMFAQMKDIKSGTRANGLSVDTMKPILDEVSEDEMRALADYLASLGPIAGKGDSAHPGKKLYMTKTCIACHGKDGTKPIMKSYPFLAGQDKAYLIRQAVDIKTSTRKNGGTNTMQPVMHLVTDEELATISDFLANVK